MNDTIITEENLFFGTLEDAIRRASKRSEERGIRHKVTINWSAYAVQNRGKLAYWLIEEI